MNPETWSAVDRYFTDALLPADPILKAALRRSADAKLPSINVSPAQGKLLHLLAKTQGAKRILEIGTLGAYSTIWLARALPADGKLITLEFDPKHAAVGARTWRRQDWGGWSIFGSDVRSICCRRSRLRMPGRLT